MSSVTQKFLVVEVEESQASETEYHGPFVVNARTAPEAIAKVASDQGTSKRYDDCEYSYVAKSLASLPRYVANLKTVADVRPV